MTDSPETKVRKRKRRTWLVVLSVTIAILIYAYAFDSTDVTLETIEDDNRQTQLFRVLRALAHPDIFERTTTDVSVEAEVQVPCRETRPAPVEESGAYIILTPNCGDPGQEIAVQGFGFEPGSTGPLAFIPPSGVSLGLGQFTVAPDGTFAMTAELKDRPDDRVQLIRATARAEVGSLHLTQTAKDTIDKALETVFMALLATTLGTVLAIPLSFAASRNLMRPIKSPMVSVALGVISLPVGLYAGILAARLGRRAGGTVDGNPALDLIALVVLVAALWAIARYLFGPERAEASHARDRWLQPVLGVGAALLVIVLLFVAADLFAEIGRRLQESDTVFRKADSAKEVTAGPLNFLALFLFLVGDMTRVVVPVITAVAGAIVLAQAGSWLGRRVVARVPDRIDRLLRYVSAAGAGAVICIVIGYMLDWLYQFDDPARTFWVPGTVGIVLGLVAAWRTRHSDQLATGLTLYYVARTVFNGLRSIEPLVMAIIFVVWVGIGPFAGALALALHTAAALAKLYSEQVESISSNPIEAVQATGANRLQVIMYAVVPQIVPPYISFTLYRWDINVRMSTIIGFVGGGGLGLLLKQNVDLLNYRAAAAQMLAIAIIVASMDYLSARLRERLV